MGIYLNTGVKKFNSALQSKIYVDKTGFLEYTNSVIDTEDRYICLSRPRRFGKSITAARALIPVHFLTEGASRSQRTTKSI